MCGRYTLTAAEEELVEVFQVPFLNLDHHPRFNIAPTQDAPVLARDSEGLKIGPLRWGLVPYWADDPSVGNRMINARSETVAEKPAFREPFRRRRCLVLADGFYEWRKEGDTKQPYWIHLHGREPFTFAGLWDRWKPRDREPIYSFTILTTDAAPSIRSLHPRMPVIVAPVDRETWLDPASGREDLESLLGSGVGPPLEFWPVSTRVNTPAHDDPDLVEPLEEGG